MNKQFQKIEILIIFIIIFISSLFVISPVARSGPLDQIYECTPIVEIEYNETFLQEPVKPYDKPTQIPIIVKTKIDGPSSDIVAAKIGSDWENLRDAIRLIIDISIAEVSDGCYASINPPILQFPISEEYKSTNATLSFTIDQYFSAFTLKIVKIQFSVRRIGKAATLVKAANITKDIPFIVSYQPQLSFSYPESNVKNVNPDETASFPIEIENWGNAETNVNAEIAYIPEGWQAQIVKNLTLRTNLFGGDAAEIITLNVKPPIGFGYHEDRAIIKVKMTPVFYNDSNNTGEPHYLYFIVQSKGFSTPGFETTILIFAIIFIYIPILIIKDKRGRKK